MKRKEVFSAIRTVPPVIVRLDGRNFKEALSRMGFQKPYDIGFARSMARAARALLEHSGLAPNWAFTFSDEISVLFTELPFDGRMEKIDSVVPSFIASALTIAMKQETPLAFDSRVIPLHPEDVVPYLVYRQSEAWRNHMQSYGFYSLVSEGMDEREAAAEMKGMRFEDIHEMMWQRWVNLNETPGWQRKGIFVYRKKVDRQGFNPVTKETVVAERREIVEDWDPPVFSTDEGKMYLKHAL
ncbi:MAG TPA: tRNA(His) guanylyltransferase Thg1 family protein [Methanocella sp.]|nr:tRNA(His) guanylyltransferase Thg1 family protein [Methanocella sp.]